MTHPTLPGARPADTPAPGLTLGALAASRPASIPVLERLGLDFCCHGGESLAAACARRGLGVEQVLEAVAAGEAAMRDAPCREWLAATMTELADHVEATHHVFVRDALERLRRLAPRVASAHGESHPELARLAEVLREFDEEMMDHLVREERVVFPWIRRLERPTEIQGGPPWSIRRPISCMVHDHESVAVAFTEMRGLTGGYRIPADACGSYHALLTLLRDLEADTRVHIHKENNILFPAAERAEALRPTRPSNHAAPAAQAPPEHAPA